MTLHRFEDHAPRIAESAYVDESAVVIGDVYVGEDASIWPRCVVRGDVHSVLIGERCNIQDGSVLHVGNPSELTSGGAPLVMGDEVTVGHGSILHGCTIGDRCFIGMGSVILDRALLSTEVMLAAGSLVAPGAILESGHLYMGRPAQRLRPLSSQEREYLHHSAQYHVQLKDRYMTRQ